MNLLSQNNVQDLNKLINILQPEVGIIHNKQIVNK